MSIAHAKFGASSAYRWMSCPGSLELIGKAPPPPPSKFAIEGTEAHSVFEAMITHWPKEQMGASYEIPRCSPEMRAFVKEAAVEVMKRFDQMPGATLYTEQKLDASWFTTKDQFGTADIIIAEEFGTLVVADLKYGAGMLVDPVENLQLIYYGLAASALFNHNFSNVELMVLQPRCFDLNGETTRTWKLSMSELLSYAPKFQEGVKAAEAPGAPLRAGSWCHFCAGAVICPKIKQEAMERAMVVFDDDKQVITTTPEPTAIAVRQLGEVLTACDQLESWIAKVRVHAEHCLSRGEKIDGWKLVEKRGRREWVQPDPLEVPLGVSYLAQNKFGMDAFTEPELLSPAQLEKKFGKDAKNFTAAHTIMKSFGTTLVPESDKRPAVNHLEAVFETIDDTQENK